MHVVVHFDGSCWPNPHGAKSRHKEGVCGYAWLAKNQTGRLLDSGCGTVDGGGLKSNNVAEYHGLLAALRWATGQEWVSELTIRGDSRLVVNCVGGTYRTHKPHLLLLRDEARRLLADWGRPWQIWWVPRAENAEADALCPKDAADPTAEAPVAPAVPAAASCPWWAAEVGVGVGPVWRLPRSFVFAGG